jgi:hypothetical protein
MDTPAAEETTAKPEGEEMTAWSATSFYLVLFFFLFKFVSMSIFVFFF